MLLKRRISGFILLSVILPMVFLAPFHHHDEHHHADISCEQCAHHQPHPGHLSDESDTDDCLICQLLAQQYVPSADLVADLFSADCNACVGSLPDRLILRSTRNFSSRAPPVPFCYL